MSEQNLSFSVRAYRALLRLLPFDFRSDFGSEMEEVFHEQRAAAAAEPGRLSLLRLWGETIAGIFRMAPREHLSVLGQDTSYALRLMRKNFGHTLLAVMILGLGIGANTAIFSVVHSTLMRPLPYANDTQLVTIRQQAPRAGSNDINFSVKEIQDYRTQRRSLSGLVEYHGMTFTLFGGPEAQRVRTGVVSDGYFDMFGVKPLLGRTFEPADDQKGAAAVLVVSYEFWQQHLKGDPQIVGRKFQMNDRVHTVVGVLPQIPQYPDENDVYMPTSACPFRGSPDMMNMRDHRMMDAFARVKPGVTPEQLRSDLSSVAARLEKDYPDAYPAAMGYRVASTPLREELTREARPMLLLLLGAAGFVLLISCANVANLTLARMAQREKELVVRAAMGAGSGRLMRQLLTESLILALLSAGAGLLFASFSMNLLTDFVARLTPRAREISIDGPVFLFATLCAVVTTVVFGSVAALYSRENIARGLKEGSSQSSLTGGQQRLRGLLIAAQVAFSYVLLVGAVLMSRSLLRIEQVDTGFVSQHVLTMNVMMNWSKYKTGDDRLEVERRMMQKIQEQPGVLSASLASSFPLRPDGGPWNSRFMLEGQVLAKGQVPPAATQRVAGVDYFKTLGIPLLSGRIFNDFDKKDTLPVAVVSRSLALHRWNGEDPIGKRVSWDRGAHWTTIVGVVGDVKEFGLTQEPPDQIYRPVEQNPAMGAILVRTAGDPMSIARQVKRAVLDVDPDTAIPRVQTLEQARSDSMASPRTTAQLFGLFAALALVIAATGIGGMLALSVSQRIREIGIRLALGARPLDVARMVVQQGMVLVALGGLAGLAGALGLTRLLERLLFQVAPNDPATFAIVSVLLPCAALAACYIPARRAAGIDPMTALRSE